MHTVLSSPKYKRWYFNLSCVLLSYQTKTRTFPPGGEGGGGELRSPRFFNGTKINFTPNLPTTSVADTHRPPPQHPPSPTPSPATTTTSPRKLHESHQKLYTAAAAAAATGSGQQARFAKLQSVKWRLLTKERFWRPASSEVAYVEPMGRRL